MRFHSVRRSARFVLGAAALLAGCGGGDRTAGGGTVIIGSAQDPKTLFPPTADGVQARAITDLIFERSGREGSRAATARSPRVAQRWEWSPDGLRLTFHVDPRAQWQDGKPVTAADVRFGFAVYTDTLVGSRMGSDLRAVVDSVSVGDSLTCTAWFRQPSPERFDVFVSSMTPLPEHLLGGVRRDSLAMSAFARSPVGDGPFKLVKWEQQVRLEVAPNSSYRGGRPVLDRVIWSFAPDASTLVKQLMAGESDFVEGLAPDAVPSVVGQPGLRLVRLGAYNYNFLQFNLRDGATPRAHPLFGDRTLRRAPTMAPTAAFCCGASSTRLGAWGSGPLFARNGRPTRPSRRSRSIARARHDCSTRSDGAPAPTACARGMAGRSRSRCLRRRRALRG
jgi:peptide/nickel transport system substrate-binding protein